MTSNRKSSAIIRFFSVILPIRTVSSNHIFVDLDSADIIEVFFLQIINDQKDG